MENPMFKDRTKKLMMRSHIANDLRRNVGAKHLHEMMQVKSELYKEDLNEYTKKIKKSDKARDLEVFDMFPEMKADPIFDDFEEEPPLLNLRRNLSGIKFVICRAAKNKGKN